MKTLWSASILLFCAPCPLLVPVLNHEYREFSTLLVNGLALWGLDANLVNGVKGVIFVIMIALSYDRSAGKLVS